MQRYTVLSVLLLIFSSSLSAQVVGKEVSYQIDGLSMKGYIAHDDSKKGLRPGILVVHEWWGHNAYTRRRADMLAKLGYVALAVDMYGDGKQANHPDTAGKFAAQVVKNLATAEKRFNAARRILLRDKHIDKQRIAAIGYCFGGGVVLAMARRGADLKGVVSFHGSLGAGAPAKTGEVKARVLVFNGANDPFVKQKQIEAFKQEMKQAKVDYEFISYPGAKHSFTNPAADGFGKKFNMPLAYNAKADKASWEKMQVFFGEIFRWWVTSVVSVI